MSGIAEQTLVARDTTLTILTTSLEMLQIKSFDSKRCPSDLVRHLYRGGTRILGLVIDTTYAYGYETGSSPVLSVNIKSMGDVTSGVPMLLALLKKSCHCTCHVITIA